MKTLFTFPGQGTQRPGMLQSLARDETWQVAHEVLGEELMQLDSSVALQHTRAVQLALLITGVGGTPADVPRRAARYGVWPVDWCVSCGGDRRGFGFCRCSAPCGVTR